MKKITKEILSSTFTNDPEDNLELTKLPFEEEIRQVVWSMDSWKAPGLVGFSGIFLNIIGRLSRRMSMSVFGSSLGRVICL